MLKLPRTSRYGGASGRREAGKSGVWEYNDLTELLEAEPTAQPKISFLLSRLSAEGSGEEPQKIGKEIFGVARVSGASAVEAQNHHAIGAYDLVRSHHALRACEVGSSKGQYFCIKRSEDALGRNIKTPSVGTEGVFS